MGLYPEDPVVMGFRNNVGISTGNASLGQKFYSGSGKIDLSPNLSGGDDTRTYVQGEEGILFNFFGNLYSAYRGLPAIGVVMTEFFNDPLITYYGRTLPWQCSTAWGTSLISTYVLQVNSSDPGVYITLSQADNNGQKDGTAPFTRIYNEGTTVTLTAPSTYHGKSFNNWSGDLSGNANPASITMNGPKSVVANFVQNQYTLTVNINPSGSGSVTRNPNKSTYVYGEQVTLTATANPGYTFTNWSGDESGSANIVTHTMNGNETVTANFTATSVTPTAYDFGNVGVKKSKTASFKVKNNGKADLFISTSITGTDVSMFTIMSGGGVSKTIKPGKTLTIKVVFKPTSIGSKSANLKITFNDPVRPTIDIPLSGTGQ